MLGDVTVKGLPSLLAERMRQGFVNSSLGYPQVERGKSMPLPPYESLEDPHLNEYFERRFGSIQYVSRVSILVTDMGIDSAL